MTTIPFTFSGNTLSAFVKGKLYAIPKSHPNYERLTAYLGSTTDHDEEHAIELLDIKTMISRLTAGKVSVVGNEVFYKGMPTRTALTQKLMEMLEAGENATPWANFLNNLMKNPSERARECAFNFLDNHATPLTPDGCFVAWKYVLADFGSAHANPDGTRVDNTPGLTVEMDRKLVNHDPNVTCSTGLHVCASPYLGGYTQREKIVKVKVNPRDICAVPKDYSFQKMRVCRYYVMEEVVNECEIARVDAQRVTEDASSKVDVLPDELVGLPLATTRSEFQGLYELERDDVEAGHLIAKKDGILVGYVVDCSEGQEEADGEFDEDGEWVEYDEGEYFWTFDIVWQTGFREDITLYDGEFGELMKVKLRSVDHDDAVDALAYAGVTEERVEEIAAIPDEDIDTSDIPEQGEEFFAKAQVFKHGERVFTARQVVKEVEETSQRKFSRTHNVPRTTLQGWLAQIDHDQIEIDDNDEVVMFKHEKSGTEIEASALVAMVQENGQRAVSRMLDVPRSTLQGWLSSI
jgi:hypothetical protein